ncbi:MAG TPA: amino acid permease [Saprospiraceae bacterium]|nr:amino acid permease [Saprospiraceae bacterium]
MNLKILFRRKQIGVQAHHDHGLKRVLRVKDITALGIAAIIGAGIFSTIGTASSEGGPGVIFLFLFTAVACGFAAFCYADFASRYPVSGSAYSYAYASFGELMAWIIGWALIMEYAIGNITVAISWSDYFTGLLERMGIHLPQWMQMDFFTARNGYLTASNLMHAGSSLDQLDAGLQQAHKAYQTAPQLLGLHLVFDVPALLIIVLITWLVYKGIHESRNASNMMVLVKLSVVLFVIVVGAFYVNVDHWSPFSPNGIGGILKGVSAVFFAYIGFDAVSTVAEECEDPQRDLPRGMFYSILICTVLYVIIALILTGMVNYNELAVGDPLAFVFSKVGLPWISGIIAVSAIFAMASVLLVFQLGQPRIWMSMSRDGLLPKKFSELHPKFKTPGFATIVTGFVVAIPALFLNLTTVTDLCSIGTLFAFVLVCGGVLILNADPSIPAAKFKIPYWNAKIYLPLLLILTLGAVQWKSPNAVQDFFTNESKLMSAEEALKHLKPEQISQLKNTIFERDRDVFTNLNYQLLDYLTSQTPENYEQTMRSAGIPKMNIQRSAWYEFKHKIPMWIFIIITAFMLIQSIRKNYSLIPVLGVLSCLYMMAQIPLKNWIGFFIWLIIGLIIYFAYGIKKSKLNLAH